MELTKQQKDNIRCISYNAKNHLGSFVDGIVVDKLCGYVTELVEIIDAMTITEVEAVPSYTIAADHPHAPEIMELAGHYLEACSDVKPALLKKVRATAVKFRKWELDDIQRSNAENKARVQAKNGGGNTVKNLAKQAKDNEQD